MVTVISRSLLLFLENYSFNYPLGINNAEIYDHWDYPFTSRGYLSRYWRGKPMDFRIQCYSAGRIIFVNICLRIFTRRLIDPDSHLGLCIQNNVYPISDHRRRFIRKKFNTLHAPEREKKSSGWILYDADVDNILLPPPKKRGAISETNCPAVAGIKRNQSSTHAWTLITIIIDWIQYLQW